MKNKIKLVALSILLAFGSVQAQSMDENANKQEYVQGQKSTYLAGYHQNKMGVNCSTCHPTDKVTDSEREIDVSCQSCHGSYRSLGEKDTQRGKPISAHKGHLSISSCTTCHQGHQESFAYCNNCHIFDMPMKFGRQKIPYLPEDLGQYDNAAPAFTEGSVQSKY